MVSTRSKGQVASSPKVAKEDKEAKSSVAAKEVRKSGKISVSLALVPVILALFIYSWYYTGIFSDSDHIVCDEQKLARNREVMSNETGINYDSLASECYFSSSYQEAKELFLRNVEKLRINNVKVSSKAMKVHGELTTDVAVIHGNKDKYILHISGTHGPEGFAGSAVQSAMLEYLYENKVYNNLEHCSSVDSVSNATIVDETCLETGLPTIVFVHALNPYGMANNRRFNEDNIDLNRNFLSLDEFHEVVARDNNIAGYDDLQFLLNPVKMPTSSIILNDIYGLARTVYSVATIGIQKLKRAMVTGTYSVNKGVYFGGQKPSRSATNLVQLVNELRINELAKDIVLIDVHSGLGPSGVDTLAFMTLEKTFFEKNLEKIEKYFPTELDKSGGLKESASGGDGAMSGYDLTIGTVTESFCKASLGPDLNDEHKICFTQEFGTKSKSMIDENYAHHYGTAEEKTVYGIRVKNSFYVDNVKWKKNVLKRGLKLVFQSLEYIQL